MPILMLTAADRLDDKASGFELGADDYLTKPFALRELVLRLRALDRRRAYNRPPVREIAGLRLDPFRREVYRDGRYVALTRKQFAVLEVLVAAEGGVISAEELLERAWDENADPFTNAVRITVSALAQTARRALADRHGARRRLPHRLRAERTVDRAPGMSARLKLTLSYAGFLMVAGVLLIAVVWLFLLRYVPAEADLSAASPDEPARGADALPVSSAPAGSTSGAPSRRKPARCWCSCWSSGWRRMVPGRPDARPADPHHQCHPPGRERVARRTASGWRAAATSSASSPTLRRDARADRSARRRAAAVRRQRLP